MADSCRPPQRKEDINEEDPLMCVDLPALLELYKGLDTGKKGA